MSVVNLETFKKHCRADDYTDDDTLLQSYLDAAEAWVIRSTERTETELTSLNDGAFPKPLAQAIYMLGAHWYNQREAVSGGNMAEVPYSLQALIKPYRKLEDDEEEDD